MTTAPCRSSAGPVRQRGGGGAADGVRRQAEAPLGHGRGEAGQEGRLDLAQGHPVLRPLRAGQRGLDRGEVQLQDVGVARLRAGGVAENALGAAVGLHAPDVLLVPPGQAQVVQGGPVHREEAHGGAVFRRHVGDDGAVGQAQGVQAGPEELDELVHHAPLPQELGDGQDEIGGGAALGQPAGEPDADDLRDQHVVGLAQHDRLGLDAADAPAHHPQAVDHGGVGVGADAGVRVGGPAAVVRPELDHLGQVLEVDLVADAGAGRDHAEVAEGLLGPAQQGVALGVPLVLEPDVLAQGIPGAEAVHLDRVVDHQVGGHHRIDPLGVAAQRLDRVAHGREVHHGGHAGEILQQDARRHVGDFLAAAPAAPAGEGLDLVGPDRPAVLVAEEVLEQDPDGVWQARQPRQAALLQPVQPVEGAGETGDGGLVPRSERVDIPGSHATLLLEDASLGRCRLYQRIRGEGKRAARVDHPTIQPRSRSTNRTPQ